MKLKLINAQENAGECLINPEEVEAIYRHFYISLKGARATKNSIIKMKSGDTYRVNDIEPMDLYKFLKE